MDQDWRAFGRVKQGQVYSRGPEEFRFEHGGFISKVYTSLADASRLGLAAYREWQDNQANDGMHAGATRDQQAAQRAARPQSKRRVSRKRASPDASTDGILQLEDKQRTQEALGGDMTEEAAAAAVARPKRRKAKATAQPAAAAAAGPVERAAGTKQGRTGAARDAAGQTPSAATDAATMPPGHRRKQQRQQAAPPAAAAAANVLEEPAPAPRAKRGRQAAAKPEPDALPPAQPAAAGAWQQPPRAKRVVRRGAQAPGSPLPAGATVAGEAAAGEPAEAAAMPGHGQQPRRTTRQAKQQAAAAADTPARAQPRRTLRARRGRNAAAAAAAEADKDKEEDPGADRQQGKLPGVKRRGPPAAPRQQQRQAKQLTPASDDAVDQQDLQQENQQQLRLGQQADGCTEGGRYDSDRPASSSPPMSDHPPSSHGFQAQQAQQQPMSESQGSNWAPAAGAAAREELAAAAGAAAKAGPTGAAEPGGSNSRMLVWYQGSKACAANLEIQVGKQLGKGGFGAVHSVQVKATGDNSLSGLKLTGPLANSLKAILKQGKASAKRSAAATPAARGCGRGQTKPTARSRAGSIGGGSDDGSSESSVYVPMALKVALSFEQISYEMQNNFKEAAAFKENVNQRMREEYDVMAACASSPHIVDAFCMGTVLLDGTWRTCIVMELSELGDAERVYIPSSSSSGPRGISSVMTQRIVRQVALALKDLHSQAGSMHLDVKVNNLLVFGSKEQPVIKVTDFGCAKKRSDEPRYGPASGTKDWQAPEQMAAGDDADTEEGPAAGRLDFCTDSWGLGLLVLSLRKGQQPFWWLKREGKLPSEMADALCYSLSSPSSPYSQDSPRGSKLTRLEVSFVSTCMASSSRRRPDVRGLLEDQSYLSSRYRGG